jgi:hypothetical protein
LAAATKRPVTIAGGQTYTTVCTYEFFDCCGGQPQKGESFTAKLRLYGHESNAKFDFK